MPRKAASPSLARGKTRREGRAVRGTRAKRAAGRAAAATAIAIAATLGCAMPCAAAEQAPEDYIAAMVTEAMQKRSTKPITLTRDVEYGAAKTVLHPERESLGIDTKAQTEMRLLMDRHSAYPASIAIETTRDGRKLVRSIRLGYDVSKKVSDKASATVRKVAAKAMRIKDRTERIRYIHDWVVLNSAYKGFSSKKWSKPTSSYGVKASQVNSCSAAQIASHRGMCHSYTLTFMRICKAAKVGDVRYVPCITAEGGSTPDHAMAAVRYGKSWLYVDCTWDEANYTDASGRKWEDPNKVGHAYFMRTAEYMHGKGHVF